MDEIPLAGGTLEFFAWLGRCTGFGQAKVLPTRIVPIREIGLCPARVPTWCFFLFLHAMKRRGEWIGTV